MNCPLCGDDDAKEIPMFTGFAVLCMIMTCANYDKRHSFDILARDMEAFQLGSGENSGDDTWLEIVFPED